MQLGHEFGGAEQVIPLDLGVRWDPGAPMPHLLQSENRTYLVFYLMEAVQGWDQTTVEVVDVASEAAASIGVIS